MTAEPHPDGDRAGSAGARRSAAVSSPHTGCIALAIGHRTVTPRAPAVFYAVEAAGTKHEALSSLAARPPAALVLDLVLPDGQGVEVCQEVRRWSRLPILVLSAVGDEREKVRALDAGADDYVTKPFGVEELLARAKKRMKPRAKVAREKA